MCGMRDAKDPVRKAQKRGKSVALEKPIAEILDLEIRKKKAFGLVRCTSLIYPVAKGFATYCG